MAKKIGILGGGQLAKMLCDSANKNGYESMILDPSEDSCGKHSATEHLIKSYDDKDALKVLCDYSDVITYEFENVPSDAIDFIQEQKANIPQGKQPLYISQHRIREKTAVLALGIQTASFLEVTNKETLIKAIEQLKFPCILKTCSGGYDGKGQWKIETQKELEQVDIKTGDYILEKMIDFDKEVSCLVVRSTNKDVVCFPIGENIHKNGILSMTIVPARIDTYVEQIIQEIAKNIITSLEFVGSLGIEFFIKGDDIYFNEMAPRPHNTAHYTLDACDYSQFDLHIKSVLGEDLPTPQLLSPVVMLNILGQDKEKIKNLVNNKMTKVHLYKKTEWKQDRKMGHINYLGEDLEKLIQLAEGF